MRNLALSTVVGLGLLGSMVMVSQSFAQDQVEERTSLRREMSSSRRVGYLRQRTDSESQEYQFVLKDAYDKATYHVIEQSGLDLAEFVDRYVSLHGATEGGTDGSPLRFSANQVTALDDQKPVSAKATNVRPASFVAPDARPIAPPRELGDIRVAALTDGLPAPSEVIGTPPLSMEIETSPESYVVEPPVTGFGWMRPPAAIGNRLDGRAYISADYLLWKTTGMQLPPLVTGNPLGTPANQAGVIGVPSTTVLIGNGTILDDAQSGFKFGAGYWFNERVALEGELFFLFEQNVGYRYDSSLNQILGRPFINLAPLAPPIRYDTELVYFPPNIDGYVNVYASSEFVGSALRLKFRLNDECQNPCVGGCSTSCDAKPKWGGLNLTAGYRYLELREYLRIEERVITAADQFDIADNFSTRSRFNGLEIGFDGDLHFNLVDVNVFSRLAGGVTNNRVQISGQTDQTTGAVVTTGNSGILAQASNIGAYNSDAASLVGEFGIDLQRQLTSNLRVNVGYSVLYWGNVARAGEQIDLNVHPGLFQPPTAVPGTIGAQPTYRFSDYFAHGLNAGVTFVF